MNFLGKGRIFFIRYMGKVSIHGKNPWIENIHKVPIDSSDTEESDVRIEEKPFSLAQPKEVNDQDRSDDA